MNKISILAVIPARGGSKGVLRKNIRELAGKPLIEYTIEVSLKSEYVSRTIVTTDNEEIASVSEEAGAEVPFIRPAELAEDDTPTLPVLQHALDYYNEKKSYEPQVVILLQPTSPLRRAEHIDEAFELYMNSENKSLISVCEVEHSPYWMKELDDENQIQPFLDSDKKYTRRQDLPPIYRPNGAIYISTPEIILNEDRIYEKNAKAYIMEKENSIDIDTKIDFELAETLIERGEG